jgi:hypothetical protein
LTSLGLSGVTDSALPAILAAMAATADNGSEVSSLAALQAIVDAALVRFNALATIAAYADSNGPLTAAPALNDFGLAGVSGVDNSNRLAIASALASTAITGAQVDTSAELQTLVDAYALILGKANGAAPDATPLVQISASDYSAIGASVAAGLSNGSAAQALLNDVVGNSTANAVDRVSKIDALATVAQSIANLAAQSSMPSPAPTLTPADFALLGISGVTSANLGTVLTTLVASADNGSAVDTQAELQTLVNTAVQAYAQQLALNALRDAAIARIAAYAGDANTAAGTTAPTLSDYQVAGITGVSSANLAALNSALATTAVIDTATDTAPEIQTLVDAYNRILAEANGPAVDATPGVNPSATDYTAIGATTAAALSTSGLALLNDVVGSLSTRQVDTVAKIEALANISAALMSTAAGGSPSPALSLADFSALGITGVTAPPTTAAPTSTACLLCRPW